MLVEVARKRVANTPVSVHGTHSLEELLSRQFGQLMGEGRSKLLVGEGWLKLLVGEGRSKLLVGE